MKLEPFRRLFYVEPECLTVKLFCLLQIIHRKTRERLCFLEHVRRFLSSWRCACFCTHMQIPLSNKYAIYLTPNYLRACRFYATSLLLFGGMPLLPRFLRVRVHVEELKEVFPTCLLVIHTRQRSRRRRAFTGALKTSLEARNVSTSRSPSCPSRWRIRSRSRFSQKKRNEFLIKSEAMRISASSRSEEHTSELQSN